MHVANNLFRAMPPHQVHGKEFRNPLHQQAETDQARLRNLSDRLNRVTDAIDVGNTGKNTEFWNRLAPHEKTAEQYRRDLQQFLHENFMIVNERQAVPAGAASNAGRISSQARSEALEGYRQYLVRVRDTLPRESFATDGGAAHIDGNSPHNLHQDFEDTFNRFVPGTIGQFIRQVDFELRKIQESSPMSNISKVIKKKSTGRTSDPAATNPTSIGTPPESGLTIVSQAKKNEEHKNADKWPTSKILGVTALGASGVGLIALAVYLYSMSNKAAKSAVQQQTQTRQAAAPHYYMQGPQAAAAPAPQLSALGYNPASPGAPQAAAPTAAPAPPFNPNPIYGYPA